MRVINIADLQNELASFLIKNPKIRLIQGSATISNTPGDDSMHTIDLDHQINELISKRYHMKPDLIVIAEGAHSINRTNAGIKLKPVLKPQQWCSGVVSLEGITKRTTKLMQVIDKAQNKEQSARTFGIFHFKPGKLFLNGQAYENESADDCLKRNAAELLNHIVSVEKTTSNTILPQSLTVVNKSQEIIDITPSKAERFFSGKNAITYGDAAGYGTPKGGIGLSLLTSVYSQAILDLLEQWNTDNRSQELQKFNERVSEIVDYWHKRIASDDNVL